MILVYSTFFLSFFIFFIHRKKGLILDIFLSEVTYLYIFF